jgi:opine dehydrogenase
MMAADLTDRGYAVHFYEHPRFEEGFRRTLERSVIDVEGIGPRGTIKIDRVSTEMAETLDGVEWIHIVMPAVGHDLFFRAMLPHLRDGHKVVLWAGDFGSLKLRSMVGESRRAPTITIIEASTLPYGTRLMGPGKVALLLTAPRVQVASLPHGALSGVLDDLHAMFPCTFAGPNVLAAAFNNPNPIVHPPGSLLNTGRIEYSCGDFYMYKEGITHAVARVIRAVYEESRRVARALGFDTLEYEDSDFEPTTSIMGIEFVAPEDTAGVIASIIGPTSLEDRYITADLPCGLVPRSELGRVVGVPTPVIDGTVSIGAIVCQEDYWKTGRTLKQLGLEGLSATEIMNVVEG